jgi:hypothetical protein
MLSEKFWKTIDASAIGKFVSNKQKIIAFTDPQRIYIENIRSFFHLPFFVAQGLCELAVREKYFNKKVGVVCANSDCERIIKSFNDKDVIEGEIICENCEAKEEENYTFESNKLKKVTFYQLKK